MNGNKKMIEILLVVGHPLILKMLKSQIEIEPDMHVIGEAADTSSALELSHQIKPNIIIIDYDSPDIKDFGIIKELHQYLPITPIILLSLSDEDVLRSQAIRAGASDVITKEANIDIFLAAIRKAFSG
jgi:DNA-binding NarL/FixJ family response regulator